MSCARHVHFASILFSAGATLLSGCATEPWTYQEDQSNNYAITLQSATPEPGTPLIAGRTTTFSLTATFKNDLSERAQAVMVFQARGERVSIEPEQVSVPADGPRGTVELSRTVHIPQHIKELQLFVPLIPEELNQTQGAIVIRYPIRRQ